MATLEEAWSSFLSRARVFPGAATAVNIEVLPTISYGGSLCCAGVLACHHGQAGGQYPHARTAYLGTWVSPGVSRSAFLKALVIMMVRRLHKVNEFLAVLAEPTPEMHGLRALLTDSQGRMPSRRTWERRLAAIPATLPAQIGCLGRHLVALLQPWTNCARAAAIDRTVLRALGGV